MWCDGDSLRLRMVTLRRCRSRYLQLTSGTPSPYPIMYPVMEPPSSGGCQLTRTASDWMTRVRTDVGCPGTTDTHTHATHLIYMYSHYVGLFVCFIIHLLSLTTKRLLQAINRKLYGMEYPIKPIKLVTSRTFKVISAVVFLSISISQYFCTLFHNLFILLCRTK